MFSIPSRITLINKDATHVAPNTQILVDGLRVNDDKKNFGSVQMILRILSWERPPIDMIIHHGVVPYLVDFSCASQNADLQFEAAWALANIASGNSDQAKAVIQAVPIFVDLLIRREQKIAEQAAWALANISSDTPYLRDYVLSFNVVKNLIELIQSNIQISFLRKITWLWQLK